MSISINWWQDKCQTDSLISSHLTSFFDYFDRNTCFWSGWMTGLVLLPSIIPHCMGLDYRLVCIGTVQIMPFIFFYAGKGFTSWNVSMNDNYSTSVLTFFRKNFWGRTVHPRSFVLTFLSSDFLFPAHHPFLFSSFGGSVSKGNGYRQTFGNRCLEGLRGSNQLTEGSRSYASSPTELRRGVGFVSTLRCSTGGESKENNPFDTYFKGLLDSCRIDMFEESS